MTHEDQQTALKGRTDYYVYGLNSLNDEEWDYYMDRDELHLPGDFDPRDCGVERMFCPARTVGVNVKNVVETFDDLAIERYGKPKGIIPESEAKELWREAMEEAKSNRSFFTKVAAKLRWDLSTPR